MNDDKSKKSPEKEEKKGANEVEKTANESEAPKNAETTVGNTSNKENSKRSGKLRIAAYVVLAIVLLFIVMIFSLGSIVKTAVNAVLPQVTGTPCSMGSCTFNPIAGRVSISHLNIGNPEGYTKKNAFELGEMTIDVGLTSLFSEKIVIDEITVKEMNVDFEVKLTETNLTRIKHNIDKFTKSDEAAKSAPDKTEPAEKEQKAEPGTTKKLEIDLIQFADNSISTGAAGKIVTIPFADMTITDIGKGPGGATVGEVSQKIFGAIYEAVIRTAKNNGWDSIKSGTSKTFDKVKSFFGGGKKK